MRRFICASCGKSIELNRCTGKRGKDLSCPDCGSRVHRDNPGPARGRRMAGARAVDSGQEAGSNATAASTFLFSREFGNRVQGNRCRRGGGRGAGWGAM